MGTRTTTTTTKWPSFSFYFFNFYYNILNDTHTHTLNYFVEAERVNKLTEWTWSGMIPFPPSHSKASGSVRGSGRPVVGDIPCVWVAQLILISNFQFKCNLFFFNSPPPPQLNVPFRFVLFCFFFGVFSLVESRSILKAHTHIHPHARLEGAPPHSLEQILHWDSLNQLINRRVESGSIGDGRAGGADIIQLQLAISAGKWELTRFPL